MRSNTWSKLPMKRAAFLVTACSMFSALAADWAQWRGPEFNGSSPEKSLPSHWIREKAEWATDLPGPGAAVPISLGDHVYISSIDDTTNTLHANWLNRKAGR